MKFRPRAITDWTLSRLGLAQPIVLVSGFWRSGTTWLQECLAESLHAKTVFEPLSPMNTRRDAMLVAAGVHDPGVREAIIPGPLAPNDPLWAYLDRAFLSMDGGHFSQTARKSYRDSLRRLIVVKDVRLQFNLAQISERYGIPIVHIRRHPGAVVSSLAAQRWPWNFDEVRLADALPRMATALADYDTDAFSRTIAYWAVTESWVERTIAGEPWARIVAYEAMAAEPGRITADLCAFIGHTQRRIPKFDVPSSSYFSQAPAAVPRSAAWRDGFTPEKLERMREICARLFPAAAID